MWLYLKLSQKIIEPTNRPNEPTKSHFEPTVQRSKNGPISPMKWAGDLVRRCEVRTKVRTESALWECELIDARGSGCNAVHPPCERKAKGNPRCANCAKKLRKKLRTAQTEKCAEELISEDDLTA